MKKTMRLAVCTAAMLAFTTTTGMTAMASSDKAFSIDMTKGSDEVWNRIAMTNDDTVRTGANIRSAADEDGEVIACLYRGGAVDVLHKGEEWTEVKSGDVMGYIRNEYLMYGTESKGLAEYYGVDGVEASWDDVHVFEYADANAPIIHTAKAGETFKVVSDEGHWIGVQFGADQLAYVSVEDVTRVMLVDEAVPMDENASYEETYTEDTSNDQSYDQDYSDGSSDNSSSGSYDDGSSNGSYDDGSADNGSSDGSYDDGSSNGSYDDGSADDGSSDDSYDDGSADDGSFDDSYDDGSADDGSSDDYTEDDTDDVYTDDTTDGTDDSYTDDTTEDIENVDGAEEYTEEAASDYTEDAATDYQGDYTEESASDYTEDTGAEYTEDSASDYTEDAASDYQEDYTDDSASDYTEDTSTESSSSSAGAGDLDLMAAIIYCEAGNQSYEGMVAVGAVVMNRVNSSSFPNSVSEVIYQSGQFTPASSGMLDSALANGVPSACYDAASAALAGENPVGSALYFNTGSGSGTKIGDHQFF